ncbi:MAG: recombination protein RecR [Deltaproteobacteria bacterium]|nr:recombination protein RecR [Deltaproteobacteria bacterium]
MRYAEPIDRLIKAFTRLPGIGEKSATRLALFVLNSGRDYATELASSVITVKDKVSLCPVCMTFSDSNPCAICSDAGRDQAVVCVVSDYKDMMALEAMGGYRGAYHILHGSLAPLKGVGPDDLKIKELIRRLGQGGIKEVILATGFDAEGSVTAMYVAGLVKPFGVIVTRIASGVPAGSFVEYMDGATLGSAMEGRRAF